ncbi:MAG: hypothetical protein LUG51_09660 [Tannerellaceae bacterium]|nr:hypothetical protein [Tannerellaceae bacterium]
MTEDDKRLLAVFEMQVRYLMALCDKQEQKINELKQRLAVKDTEAQQSSEVIRELKTKYDNLLTARIVSVNEEDAKDAKKRLSKLVREVDKCIALLNE